MDKPHDTIHFLDPSNPGWTDIIKQYSDSTLFHHPVWANLIREAYGYIPKMAVLSGLKRDSLALLPMMEVPGFITGKNIVAMPFSDFCQPLYHDEGSLSSLIEGLQLWRKKKEFDTIKVHWRLPGKAGVYPSEIFARHVSLLTTDSQEVFNSFAKGYVSRGIRKSERNGVRIVTGSSWSDMTVFYGLHLATRRRLGVPIQPYRFFKLLWDKVISQDHGFILLAYKDLQPLAGAVFLNFNQTLTYKYGASDPQYWFLRPNNLLLWSALKYGCENGYKVFDWGRTDLNNTGLRAFKNGWGSQEQILGYSVLADRPPKSKNNAKALQTMSFVIRNSPQWVCRLMGELLYPNFAV